MVLQLVATEASILVFAVCYQTLNLFCREKLCGFNAPKFIGIGPLLAKLQVIEVDTRFVNISSIFEILFFIFELKREVLADCCKMSSRNAIWMIFSAN